ncbi:MAG: RNA polymerase sigma factor [Bryobacterales bacterium]|nr:RNA polymerase sigma factor [Bryobacterales bacterium]
MFVFTVDSKDDGRQARLARLYDQHVNAVFRYAWRVSGRRDLAEDLTNESFLALYRNLQQVDDGRLPAWLFTVVKNLAIDHWRKASREQAVPEQIPAVSPEPQGPSFEDLIARAKGLKPVHRICLTLRYVHGMDRQEIAKHTGMSDNQIKSALQYALELLRREMTA